MKTSRRFDDQSYILAYQQRGAFPHIHQDIAAVIRQYASEPEPCMDIGACINLLSAQAVEIGRAMCVAVEANEQYIAKAVMHPKVVQEKLQIGFDTLPAFEGLLQTYRPTLLIARRVFSEFEGVEFVQRLSLLFWQHGVKKIVLEGRTATKRATNIMPNADAEVRALSPYYTVRYAYRDVRFLLRQEV
jgi:hypothetical protein